MTGTPQSTVLLSHLVKHAVLDARGKALGQIADAIVTLRGEEYPLLTGLVAKVGNRTVFVPIGDVLGIAAERVELRTPKLDLRAFERRTGEVLLRADVLGHRLIDVDRAVLVRAHNAQLTQDGDDWVLTGLDVHKRRMIHLGRRHEQHPMRDWHSFEALIGHKPSILVRSLSGRLRRLKPAQIADLIEDASRREQDELLSQVHTDPELEADVFEELDNEKQIQLLRSRPTQEIAAVIARMRADDAADAIMDLPQEQRSPVLDQLSEPQRTKVRGLLGYNTLTAGGLMGVDYVAAHDTDTVEQALDLVRASTVQAEALTKIFTLDSHRRLTGTISLVQALQADPRSILEDVTDRTPIHAHPDDDVIDVARQMADFNLVMLPVIDDDTGRLLGAITVDDALEAAIPHDWKRREPHHHAAIRSTTEPANSAPRPQDHATAPNERKAHPATHSSSTTEPTGSGTPEAGSRWDRPHEGRGEG